MHGSGGSVSARNHNEARIAIADRRGFTEPPLLDFFMSRYAAAYAAEIEAFAVSVQSGLKPPVTGYDGLQALLLAEAAVRSVAEGRKVGVAEVSP